MSGLDLTRVPAPETLEVEVQPLFAEIPSSWAFLLFATIPMSPAQKSVRGRVGAVSVVTAVVRWCKLVDLLWPEPRRCSGQKVRGNAGPLLSGNCPPNQSSPEPRAPSMPTTRSIFLVKLTVWGDGGLRT